MADIPGLDEFAQTRGADDLFDDEIIPVAPEEVEQFQAQAQAQAHQPEPEPQPQLQLQPQATEAQAQAVTVTSAVEADTRSLNASIHASIHAPSEPATRTRGGERRGRGRGRGRGGRVAHNATPRQGQEQGHGQEQRQRRSETPKQKPEERAVTEPEAGNENGNEEEAVVETPAEGETAETPGPEDSSAATASDAPRVPAVRGDRSATGGLKKPKLTEEQLSQRIAAARENAAKKAAAHARAEADQASFMEREKVAEKKRREERQNRRVMDTERERNRIRKLQALNGREWDADKPEQELSARGGRGQYRRGMHGGVSGVTRQGLDDSQPGEEALNDDASQPHGHRGGRGRGGRGGRGRGNHRASSDRQASDTSAQPAPTLVITNEAEFPALPGEKKTDVTLSTDKPAVLASADKAKALSPVSGATWADQVEDQPE
ncbi:hypothetical protein BJX70DRAFT_400448 [Aspergillus crustosus]